MTGTPIQSQPSASERFQTLEDRANWDEYNFEHFESRHLVADIQRTQAATGIEPGETAPDFELARVGGGSVRLSELRGRPVLLRFGSFS